jgi:hypothetical protein
MQYISTCQNCGGIVYRDQPHLCGMYLYDQAGYMGTLDSMLYKQRLQDPSQHMYASHIDQLYQTDENKLKDYMERVTRENLEAKNKLYQAHMRMQTQLQTPQVQQFANYSPQDMYQTQMQSQLLQNYQQMAQQFQQNLYQQTPQQQLQQQLQLQQQQLQQSFLQQKLPQSHQALLSQQPLMQQPSPLSLQMVPTTPAYYVPSNMPSIVPQQLNPQQLYQLQQALQQKRTEAFARNKEKLTQMAQIPYGWQFDPNAPLVCGDLSSLSFLAFYYFMRLGPFLCN